MPKDKKLSRREAEIRRVARNLNTNRDRGRDHVGGGSINSTVSTFSHLEYSALYPNGKYAEHIVNKIEELIGNEMRKIIDNGIPPEGLPTQELNKTLTAEDLIIIEDESGSGYRYELRRPFWLKKNDGEKFSLMAPDVDLPGPYLKEYGIYIPLVQPKQESSEQEHAEEVEIVDVEADVEQTDDDLEEVS